MLYLPLLNNTFILFSLSLFTLHSLDLDKRLFGMTIFAFIFGSYNVSALKYCYLFIFSFLYYCYGLTNLEISLHFYPFKVKPDPLDMIIREIVSVLSATTY